VRAERAVGASSRRRAATFTRGERFADRSWSAAPSAAFGQARDACRVWLSSVRVKKRNWRSALQDAIALAGRARIMKCIEGKERTTNVWPLILWLRMRFRRRPNSGRAWKRALPRLVLGSAWRRAGRPGAVGVFGVVGGALFLLWLTQTIHCVILRTRPNRWGISVWRGAKGSNKYYIHRHIYICGALRQGTPPVVFIGNYSGGM